MPQIQVLPAVPTFGSKLAQVLGAAGANIGQGYAQRKQRRADESVLEGIMKNPNASPMDMIGAYGKLSPEARKDLQPLFNTILGNQGKLDVQKLNLETKKELQQNKAATAVQIQQDIQKLKDQEAAKKNAEDQQGWERIFKDLEARLPYVGQSFPFTKTMFSKFPWSKASQEREFFDVTAFQLERYARAAHTKGAMSTKVYESLLSKLPDSKLSEAKNIGRIKAWQAELIKNKNIPENLEELIEDKPPLESFYR